MEAKLKKDEISLLQWAADWLLGRLPDTWSVHLDPGEQADTEPHADGRLVIQSPSGSAWIAVEARRSLSPLGAENLLPRLAQILRSMSGNVPVLIVAPWLSQRTQELLAAQGVNYLDQTGNALVKLTNPAEVDKLLSADDYLKKTGH